MSYFKGGDKKRRNILLFLKKYDSEISDNQLRGILNKFIKQKLIERKRYSIYGLTKEGERWEEILKLEAMPSFKYKEVMKIFNKLPPHLRAFLILYFCGIIARYHLRPHFKKGFPSFSIYGVKGVGKSTIAEIVFRILGLDPEKYIRYVPNATPKELGLRHIKKKGGYVIDPSSYFQEPAICFDEVDKASKDIKNALLIYFQAGRVYFVEQTQIEQKVCAMMTSNESPEEMKISHGFARRTPTLNTDAIQEEFEDVDLILRNISKSFIPHIKLEQFKPKLKELTKGQYKFLRDLLKRCVTNNAWQYKVDTESTEILSLAMHAFLNTKSIEEAMLDTLYYRLLLLETTEDTVEDWEDTFFKSWEKIAEPEQIIEPENKKKVEVEVEEIPAMTSEKIEVEEKLKKFEDKKKIITEFEPRYEKIKELTETSIKNLENLKNHKYAQLISAQEKRKIDIIIDIYKTLRGQFRKIKKGDWTNLKAFELAFFRVFKDYSAFLKKISNRIHSKMREEELIQDLKTKYLPPQEFADENYQKLQIIDNSLDTNSIFTKEQKDRIRQNFPKEYWDCKKRHEKLINTINELKKIVSTRSPPIKEQPLTEIPQPKKQLPTKNYSEISPAQSESIIGKAKFYHRSQRRWINCQILKKKIHPADHKPWFYVTWPDNRGKPLWLHDSQFIEKHLFG